MTERIHKPIEEIYEEKLACLRAELETNLAENRSLTCQIDALDSELKRMKMGQDPLLENGGKTKQD